MPEKYATHLRLVPPADSPTPNGLSKTRGPKQLAFSYPEPDAVVLIDVSAIGPDEFADVLGLVRPTVVVDTRPVPRLDTLAGSRRQAFDLFQRYEAYYIDLFGRLNINSYRTASANPAFWAASIVEILQKEVARRGPYLFLFDDAGLIAAAEDVFPTALRPAIGNPVQVSRFSPSAGN